LFFKNIIQISGTAKWFRSPLLLNFLGKEHDINICCPIDISINSNSTLIVGAMENTGDFFFIELDLAVSQ
jgi:hypothetical protein